MFNLLLVCSDKASLSGLASVLAEYSDVDLSWAESGEQALNIALDTTEYLCYRKAAPLN